jgi:hypothetical protein
MEKLNRDYWYSTALSGLLVTFTLLFIVPSYVGAQDFTLFLQFDYLKSKSESYASLESEIWKPVHESRIRENEMIYWRLYRVNFPGGSKREYDYVAISAFRNIEPLQDRFAKQDEWLEKVHPTVKVEDIKQQTQEARDQVWSEVFVLLDQARPPRPVPGRFMMVNQMRVTPGRENRYERMEKEIYLPAHKILIDEKMLVNWHLLRRFAPQGTKYGYNYLTLDVYDDLQQIGHSIPEEIWHAAHPSRDLTSFFVEIDVENMRELTCGEIWELLDYVPPH